MTVSVAAGAGEALHRAIVTGPDDGTRRLSG